MKNYTQLCLLAILLIVSSCEPPYRTIEADVYNATFKATEEYNTKTGQSVFLKNVDQFYLFRNDTLTVRRNDSTLIMMTDLKKNYELDDKKNGIIVWESRGEGKLRSIRIAMGNDYRKNPQSSPMRLGQVVEGKYDPKLDSIQTIYVVQMGLIHR